MKRRLQLLVLIVGCCLTQSILFGQDGMHKEWAVKFSGYKTKLSRQANATMDSIATAMKNAPSLNYVISTCVVCKGPMNAVNWDRVNIIVNKLIEKYGIAAERFVFLYDDRPDDCNEIRFRYTDEKVSLEAPPHPNLRKKTNEPPCTPIPSSAD